MSVGASDRANLRDQAAQDDTTVAAGTAVAVLGASRKPHRYSNQAVVALKAHGYEVTPVNPAYDEIEGLPAARGLAELPRGIHTLTVYVGPYHIRPMIDEIVALRPQRVILNPGTESAELERALDAAGIRYLEACTLVLLATGQYATAYPSPRPPPPEPIAAAKAAGRYNRRS